MFNRCPVKQRSLRISITIAVTLATGSIWSPRSHAQALTFNDWYRLSASNSTTAALHKAPLLAQAQEATTQVIKMKLNDLNEVSEWIRLERTGNQVKLLHTVVAPSGVARVISAVVGIPSAFSDSDAARGVGLIASLPPLVHTWYDHPTSRIVFVPDTCPQPSASDCSIVGTTTLTLPAGIKVDQGQFTLEYTESKLVRTVTFRVPPQKP